MNKVIALYNSHANVRASFNFEEKTPQIDRPAYIHSLAAVIGNVHLGKRVMVAPAASVRGDEGQPIWASNDVNIQDCAALHALETHVNGKLVREAGVEVDGVYISDRVSLAHQSQVYGLTFVCADTFVGMQALVFRATVDKNCVIEPKALVMDVNVPDNRYVPAGAIVTTQTAANHSPFTRKQLHLTASIMLQSKSVPYLQAV